MYKLSRDYKKLYKLLSEGNEFICFVDYQPDKLIRLYRDVCIARRHDYGISFQSRGIGYGGVDEWDPQTIEYFEAVCAAQNIEWIVPSDEGLIIQLEQERERLLKRIADLEDQLPDYHPGE